MKNSRASERYAKSLLQLSIDKDLVEEIKSDIDMLIIIFSESREVSNLYLSPIIPIHHKVEITNKIFSKKINENTLNLILNVHSNFSYFEYLPPNTNRAIRDSRRLQSYLCLKQL